MSSDDPRPRVVVDCMVFLQATASDSGPAAAILRLVDRNTISLFVSREILDQVRDVLSRSNVQKKNPDITSERIDALLARLSDKASLVDAVPQHFSFVRDPKDEKYLNLAIDVEADYLVTRDRDLLDLMTGHGDECKDFRRRFSSLKVIGPVEFLKSVELEDSNE